MRKIISLFAVCIILVTYVQPVSASESGQRQAAAELKNNIQLFSDNGRAVESIFYNEDGEEIVNYADFSIVADEPAITEVSLPMGIRRDTITYNSSLGPVNNYSYLWAYSHATRDINRMIIVVHGYRDNGYYIGEDVQQNPDGTTVAALSAYIKPLDLGLDYKVGSGVSVHQYYCDGHEDITHNLVWQK